MPSGIPVATVALDGAKNAAILACQIIATGDTKVLEQVKEFKAKQADKIVMANKELSAVKYEFKTN